MNSEDLPVAVAVVRLHNEGKQRFARLITFVGVDTHGPDTFCDLVGLCICRQVCQIKTNKLDS